MDRHMLHGSNSSYPVILDFQIAWGCTFVVRSPGQVEVLLRAKADFVESSALNGAASRANTATVAALLQSRCDPDYPSGETSDGKKKVGGQLLARTNVALWCI